jgi:hypothetical protein
MMESLVRDGLLWRVGLGLYTSFFSDLWYVRKAKTTATGQLVLLHPP